MALLVHQNKPRRSPSSTIAWLLAIVLVPWLGVPAYIFFGGRKSQKMIRGKRSFGIGAIDATKHLPLQMTGSNFPIRSDNGITLLQTGEEAFIALNDLLEQAETSIDIATYILSNDNTGAIVLATLARKASEGVRVRLLLDALGSFSINKDALSSLRSNGGQCAFFMPMIHLPFRGRANLRNHRKIAIVDSRNAILGGMNIAQEYMGPAIDDDRWQDLSFFLMGSAIADLQSVFNSDWSFAAKQEVIDVKVVDFSNSHAITTIQVVPSGPDVGGDQLYENILSMLFSAKQRVWIVTPYFVPDEMLIKAICIAAKRGVDVRILVPLASNHRIADLVRRSFLRQMQESGATVYKFTPGMMHGKAILIDDGLAVVGSMNMDLRSFFLNYEIALYIYDKNVVQKLDSWARGLMKRSTTGVRTVGFAIEMIEGVARLLAPLL